MRVTVLILSLLLGAVMFVQTFLVYALSSGTDDRSGSVGILMSLLWLVAAAFVIPLPMVSVIAFVFAGLRGFSASGDFSDLAIWASASLVLALLSFFGWRGKRKGDLEARREKIRQLERDERLEEMLRTRA